MEVFLSMDHGLLVTRNVEEVSNLALALVVTLHQKEAERNAPDLPQRVENATKRFAMVSNNICFILSISNKCML